MDARSSSAHKRAAPLDPWRKALIAAIAIAAVGLAALVVFMMTGKSEKPGMSHVPIGVVLSVDPTQLPSGFEEHDIPVESNVPVTESYNMRIDGGKGIQSVRSHISQKSVEDKITEYKEYIDNSGWILTLATTTESGETILSAQLKSYAGVQLSVNLKPLENKMLLVETYLVRREI